MKDIRGYGTLLAVAILFVIPLLFAPSISVRSIEEYNSETQEDLGFNLADTDTSRVDWQLNHYDSPGFEVWDDSRDPGRLSTYRSTEHFTGYSTSNYSEGVQGCVMQAKAVDSDYPAEALLYRSWASGDFPNTRNLTVSFDWIVDALPNPVDGDYFRFELRLGSPNTRYLRYYLGCENTVVSNSSSYHYYMLEGSISGWTSFDRNVSQDYFDMAGVLPTQINGFRWELRSSSTEYSRIYMDDVNFVNSTTTIIGGSSGNGNFENQLTWYRGNNDPADIVQSTDKVEGDFSLNATSLSNGNTSTCSFSARPDTRLTSENIDSLKFQWNITDFAKATENTYASVYVGANNISHSFYIYYPLCYGGYEFPRTYSGYHYINATGFNTTMQWNQFERSIWNDITSYNSTSFLIIEEIEIEIRTEDPSTRISILFDDISFTSASLNDMDYENQGAVGDEVLAWDISSGLDSHFTVTDLAYDGSKAGNITADDGDSWGGGQEIGALLVNNETDLWLDFWWRFENFTGLPDDLVYLEVYLDNNEDFAYIFGNGSSVYIGNGFDEFIIVPNNGTEGTWFNFQRNLYDDYVSIYGVEPDTFAYELYLNVESETGGRVEFLLDDVYMYTDPAPAIENLLEVSGSVVYDEPVEITVDV
ncbi:MAG: hypothetical protein ACXAEF_14565, partial [Candidatus Thorarchaeota archaeon]